MVTKLLRTGLAAQQLGIHSQTLYRWIKAGVIQAIRLPSGEFRIDQQEINQILLHGRLTAKQTKKRKLPSESPEKA